AVTDLAPAQPAPTTMPIAASSSSAWTTVYVGWPSGSTRSLGRNSLRASMKLVDGVIGYQAATLTPPNTEPRAPASLPVMRIRPSVAFMGSTTYGSTLSMLVAAHAWALRTTSMLLSMSFALPPEGGHRPCAKASSGATQRCDDPD